MRKSFVRSNILLFIVICIGIDLGWQYLSNRIQERTFSRLNSGLYKAMVFTERHGKRTLHVQGQYYYTNLNEAENFAMVKSYLTNYIHSHDSSVELKSITFRMQNSDNLNGLATVGVHVLPGVTKKVQLNDGVPLMHFTHLNGSS